MIGPLLRSLPVCRLKIPGTVSSCRLSSVGSVRPCLIDLRRTFVGHLNRIPAVSSVLLPAIFIASVDLSVLAGVQVSFTRTANHALFTRAGLVADERALLPPHGLRRKRLVSTLKLAGTDDLVTLLLALDRATAAFRRSEIGRP